MWDIPEGDPNLRGQKKDPVKAAETAAACGSFSPDCEEECVADEEISCFNCRYRRWTRDGFDCMKEKPV